MKLSEKAEASPDVDLARQSAPGAYRLETDELVPADDLTPDGDFPEYGDFLEVSTTRGRRYIECPQALAEWLVDHDLKPGEDWFRIVAVRKVDGQWVYDVEWLSEDEVAQHVENPSGQLAEDS